MHESNPLAPLCDLHLSDKEKRLLWQRIVQGQQKSLFLRKVFFATRVTGYVAVSTLGVFVLASSFWPQQLPRHNDDTSAPIMALRTNSQVPIAQADTIGRLVEIQGVVHVINNGTILPKTDLVAGETVVLQPGAELVLQIRAATFATIQGPAKFVLEYIPETKQTVLNLLEGEIIEVTTKVTPTESTKDVSPTPAPTSPTLTDNVVIKTKLVEVTPPTDHASSFVIHQQDKSAEVIATQGENMLVKQLTPTLVNDDSGEELLVSAGTHAHVDLQGIHIPSSSDEAVQLARQSKDLTIRYEKPTTDDVALLALVADTTNEDTDTPSEIIDTTILSDIAAKTAGSPLPTILPTHILERLTQTLHPTITAQNLADMKQRQHTNTNAYIIAYRNLLDQLNQAYRLVELAQPATSTDSLDAGISVAQYLLTHLETTYTTPPSLHASLQAIISGLANLKQNQAPEHNAADDQPNEPQQPNQEIALPSSEVGTASVVPEA